MTQIIDYLLEDKKSNEGYKGEEHSKQWEEGIEVNGIPKGPTWVARNKRP